MTSHHPWISIQNGSIKFSVRAKPIKLLKKTRRIHQWVSYMVCKLSFNKLILKRDSVILKSVPQSQLWEHPGEQVKPGTTLKHSFYSLVISYTNVKHDCLWKQMYAIEGSKKIKTPQIGTEAFYSELCITRESARITWVWQNSEADRNGRRSFVTQKREGISYLQKLGCCHGKAGGRSPRKGASCMIGVKVYLTFSGWFWGQSWGQRRNRSSLFQAVCCMVCGLSYRPDC